MQDKEYSTYKELEYENKINYFDTLSSLICSTIYDLKSLDDEYVKFKNIFKDKSERVIYINLCFNELKSLFWMKFCNQQRDYLEILKHLLKNEKKYGHIEEYIESSNFISIFWGKESYSALSLTLHNLNKFTFGQEKWDSSFSKYDFFNDALLMEISKIQKEYEHIIFLFRKAEGYEACATSLCFTKFSQILEFMNLLIDK
ncbi:MAG: hypothetical protein ACRDAW_03310 [Metamycoplasmataceae bacterium]